MPLFAGRVGAVSHQYQVPRVAYYVAPSSSTPALQHIHLTPVNLSSAKLCYDAKNPRNTSTLWEYALRIGSSFMVVSVSGIRRKMEMAVEKCVREDPEFWDMLRNTGNAIIIFEYPHWLWGRYRPASGQFWSGRNELGEILMQVREGYKNSLARLMPLEPFPLYAPSGNASPANPSPLGQSIGSLQQEIGLQSPPRFASASMPTRGRSTMSMDRLPSAPFSRFAAPSLSLSTRHNSPNSNASLTALSPAFGVSEVPCPRRVSPTMPLLRDAPFPQARQGIPLPPVLSFDGPALPHRSPVPSISSVRSPPPPYTSNPASPAPSFDAGFGDRPPGVGPLGRAYGLGIQRPIVSDPPPSLHGQNVQRLPGTGHTLPLPPRLRGLHVNEDLERQQLNRLREEYHAGKRLPSLTDNVAELRNMNVRRLEQHDAALASRRMRELERSNFLRQLSRKEQDVYPPLGHQVDGSEADSLRKAEELGALRAREIEAKLVAHRRALRNLQEERRDRKLEEIERLAGRSARSGLNPNAEEFRFGNAGFNTDVALRDRRYSTPLY